MGEAVIVVTVRDIIGLALLATAILAGVGFLGYTAILRLQLRWRGK